MAKKAFTKRTRERIAQEAARLISEEGIQDYYLAKQKAAQRLAVFDSAQMPSNLEIEQELVRYQNLFKKDTQPQQLTKLRRLALQAMRFLQNFEPRLVGSVLAGTADTFSPVQIQLFADAPEEILIYLMEKNIPYRESTRRFRDFKNITQTFPCYCFIKDNIEIELQVLPFKNLKLAPRNPVDGKPMSRADIKELEVLLSLGVTQLSF